MFKNPSARCEACIGSMETTQASFEYLFLYYWVILVARLVVGSGPSRSMETNSRGLAEVIYAKVFLVSHQWLTGPRAGCTDIDGREYVDRCEVTVVFSTLRIIHLSGSSFFAQGRGVT